MELDGLAVGEIVFFGEECGAEGGLAVVAELLVGEAGEDGGLAHTRVTHCDQLYLVHLFPLLFRHYRFIISQASPIHASYALPPSQSIQGI